jgi:hypothetical protein
MIDRTAGSEHPCPSPLLGKASLHLCALARPSLSLFRRLKIPKNLLCSLHASGPPFPPRGSARNPAFTRNEHLLRRSPNHPRLRPLGYFHVLLLLMLILLKKRTFNRVRCPRVHRTEHRSAPLPQGALAVCLRRLPTLPVCPPHFTRIRLTNVDLVEKTHSFNLVLRRLARRRTPHLGHAKPNSEFFSGQRNHIP